MTEQYRDIRKEINLSANELKQIEQLMRDNHYQHFSPFVRDQLLRHSHDSFMINILGKNVLAVSQRSGRIDKATTLNTYSHFYNARKQTVGNEITELLKKEGVSSTPR